MRWIYFTAPVIFLLFLFGGFGIALQMGTPSVVSEFSVNQVKQLGVIDYDDGIGGLDGGLAISYDEPGYNRTSISVFSNDFQEEEKYQANHSRLYERLFYLDNDHILSGREASFANVSGHEVSLHMELQHSDRKLGNVSPPVDIRYNYTVDTDKELQEVRFTLRWQQSKIIQDRVYIPFLCDFRYIEDARDDRTWGLVEVDLQNLQTRSWTLGTTDHNFLGIYVHPDGSNPQVAVETTYSSNTSRMVYEFDPDTSDLETLSQVDYDCEGRCYTTFSDNHEFVFVKHVNHRDHDEFVITRESSDEKLYTEIDGSLDLLYAPFVGDDYLAIEFEENEKDYEWFYLLNHTDGEIVKLPANPGGFDRDWNLHIVDLLTTGELVTRVFTRNSDYLWSSYLYKYDLNMAQRIDKVRQLGWGIPSVSVIIGTGLGWLVLRSVRQKVVNETDQSGLYPELD